MAHRKPLSTFTPSARSRLALYKAAVASGLYTDSPTDSTLTYRFTVAELARLVVYKAAIAAGIYSDQIADEPREN